MKQAKIRIFFLSILVVVLVTAAILYSSFEQRSPQDKVTISTIEVSERQIDTKDSEVDDQGKDQSKGETIISEEIFYISFNKSSVYSEGHVYKIATGDLDGDTLPDLAIANYNRQNYMFINRAGQFEQFPKFGTGYSVDIKIVDVDHDGLLDVIVLKNKEKSEMFINDGDLSFTKFSVFNQGQARAMTVNDFNNDGYPDVFVGYDSEPSHLYMNNKHKGFQEVTILTDLHITSVDSCDLDKDGFKDIVIGTEVQKNYVLINNGDGTFTVSPVFEDEDTTTSIVCVDLNDDDLPEVIVGNNNQASNEERNFLYINNGNLDFTKTHNFGASTTYSLDTGDLNGDGLIDVVVGNYEKESKIYFNQGNFNFKESSMEFEKDYVKDLKAVDFNNDGFSDLATALDKNGLNVLITVAKKA